MDCLTLHAVTAILEKADLLRCLMRNAYLKRLHRPGIHLSQPESARERESEGERPRTRIHLQLAHELRGVNIMAKIWFRLFKQCQMMKSQEQTRKASSVWGLSVFFTLEAPHKFQWGICIEVDWSRQAPIQVWPPWRERGREREREREHKAHKTMVNCFWR